MTNFSLNFQKSKNFPDCVHRTTKKALWVDGKQNPSCVEAELAKLSGLSAEIQQFSNPYHRLPSGNTIRKLLKQGRLDEAFWAAKISSQHGSLISSSIAFCLLQGCIDNKDLRLAKELHGFFECNGFLLNPFIGCHLIRVYAACDSLLDVQQVFSSLPVHDVFIWTAVISAHVETGHLEMALDLFCQMQRSCVEADEYLYVAVLRACSSLELLTEGKLIHAYIVFCGLEVCVHVAGALVDIYSRCGSFKDAEVILSNVPRPSAATWNALIGGCAKRGNDHAALQLFGKMQLSDTQPNAITLVSALQACSNIANVRQGMITHGCAIESNFESDVFVGSILIDMYARCGSLSDAQYVFKKLPKHDLVTWSAMMTGYCHHLQGDEVLILFEQLVQEGLEPNDAIFVSVLKACTCTSIGFNGNHFHGHIVENGYEVDDCVSTMLIDVLVKNGSLEDARSVFANVREQGVVHWTSMIAGYSYHGHRQESLGFFKRMLQESQLPNMVTFISALNACLSIAALFQGKLVHSQLVASGSDLDEVVGIALINMYRDCGSLTSATAVFENLRNCSVETWTAIIVACAEHGDFRLASFYFEKMEVAGLKPDEITYVSLLSACCHEGQVYSGCLLFRSLVEKRLSVLRMEHYNSMVGLLGSSGYLMEAQDLLLSMPILPNVVGWTALLTHCKTHSNAELGGRCFTEMAAGDQGI